MLTKWQTCAAAQLAYPPVLSQARANPTLLPACSTIWAS